MHHFLNHTDLSLMTLAMHELTTAKNEHFLDVLPYGQICLIKQIWSNKFDIEIVPSNKFDPSILMRYQTNLNCSIKQKMFDQTNSLLILCHLSIICMTLF